MISELLEKRDEYEAEITALKAMVFAIDEQVSFLAKPVMEAKLASEGKSSGSFKLNIDGASLQGEIRKTVKWSSDALKEVASKIPAEDAAVIFDVALSIREEQLKVLEECHHPALGEILMARSVTYSKFSARPIKEKAKN